MGRDEVERNSPLWKEKVQDSVEALAGLTAVDGATVWPEVASPFPAPVIATLERGRPLRLAFGSCRTSVSHVPKRSAR